MSTFFSLRGLSSQGREPAGPGERKEGEGGAGWSEGKGETRAEEEGGGTSTTEGRDFFSSRGQSHERGVGAREETGRDPTEGGAREGTEARETRELRGSGWGRAPLTGGLGAGRKMGANLMGGGNARKGDNLTSGGGGTHPRRV